LLRFAVRAAGVLCAINAPSSIKKIERYWKLSAAISDRLALDGIKAAIEDLQAQKAALHLEQKP